jgi:hypothetical protein
MGALPEIPPEWQWAGVLATFVGGVFVAVFSYIYKLGAAAHANSDKAAFTGAAIVDSTVVEEIGAELGRVASAAERLAEATEVLAAIAKKTAEDADRARDRAEILALREEIENLKQGRFRPEKKS